MIHGAYPPREAGAASLNTAPVPHDCLKIAAYEIKVHRR
ncbi:hypothetical protein BN2537_7499 [Streptomyces venezuelae]|nr:hypothetical protein BN2537_7499 [Streptomyces venezuelae]